MITFMFYPNGKVEVTPKGRPTLISNTIDLINQLEHARLETRATRSATMVTLGAVIPPPNKAA